MRIHTNGPTGIGAGGLGDILSAIAMTGGDKLGEPIARGKEAVLKTMNERFEKETGSPMPADKLAQIEQQIAEAGDDDVALHEVDGGVVISAVIKSKGNLDGFDLGSIMSAARYSDRHGGKSAVADIGEMLGGHGSPFESLRDRLKAAAQERKKQMPIAPILMIACPIVSGALLAYSKEPNEKAVNGCKDLAKNLHDAEADNPVRFGNLSRRLKGYGFHLASIRSRLEKFAEKPTAAEAVELSNKLALMAPALICVMKDTSDDIDKMRQI